MTAQQLREIRQSLNLSQTDFAKWFGKNVAKLRAVQYWESGKRPVPAYIEEILRLKGQL